MHKTNMIEGQDEHRQSNKPLQIDEDSPAADNNRTYDIKPRIVDNEITTAPKVVTIMSQLSKITMLDPRYSFNPTCSIAGRAIGTTSFQCRY